MNRILLITLISFLLSVPCFANDIYTGESTGYSCYLQSDSIQGTFKVTPGNPLNITKIIYSVKLIPNQEELENLKTLMLDDDISYMIVDYRYEEYFNRVTNTTSFDKLFLVKKSLYDSSGNEKYIANKNGVRELPQSDKDDAITAYQEMFKYINTNTRLVKSI